MIFGNTVGNTSYMTEMKDTRKQDYSHLCPRTGKLNEAL
jgi:hypothetical protein